MRLAIIPARGGSKRIPRKNIKLFHGKPIIAYSIETALASKLFDVVIVSTDDSEIARVAEDYGATVPFMRPAELSDDYANTNDVIVHAINYYKNHNFIVDCVCCIYATAPFLKVDDLLGAYAKFDDTSEFVFAAAEFSYPIFRAFRLDEFNRVSMFWPENFYKRSQDFETAYHDAGMFYLGKTQAFLEKKPFFDKYAKAYVIPHYRVQDIDTLDDWYRAEKFYHLLNED